MGPLSEELCFYLNSQSGLQNSSLRYTPKYKTTGCFFPVTRYSKSCCDFIFMQFDFLCYKLVWSGSSKWFGALCLVVHISVVMLSLGLNLISLERLLISLFSNFPLRSCICSMNRCGVGEVQFRFRLSSCWFVLFGGPDDSTLSVTRNEQDIFQFFNSSFIY